MQLQSHNQKSSILHQLFSHRHPLWYGVSWHHHKLVLLLDLYPHACHFYQRSSHFLDSHNDLQPVATKGKSPERRQCLYSKMAASAITTPYSCISVMLLSRKWSCIVWLLRWWYDVTGMKGNEWAVGLKGRDRDGGNCSKGMNLGIW